jgi:hypothetical protein
METDSLNHIVFDCHYSGALHKRQTWLNGIHDMIQHSRRQQQQWTWRVDSAKEEVYLELQNMYTRHSHKLFLWRGLWPTFLRQNLSDRLHFATSGAHWAQDKYRKILTRAVQLFGMLSFTTLQEINELRHKVALQIMVRLNQLPTIQSQHIPRIPHAHKTRLPRELGIPPEEVTILVEHMLRKTTVNVCNMRGHVLRFLERGDKHNYQEWLTRQQSEGTITQSQMADRWSSFLSLPMEAKRQQANQAREALGKQVVPWTLGTPPTRSNTGHVLIPCRRRPTRGNTASKRCQSERSVDGNTVDRPPSNHRHRHTDLTWDEFLQGYASPFSSQRIDPLNQQWVIRWNIEGMPA